MMYNAGLVKFPYQVQRNKRRRVNTNDAAKPAIP
jgi:hypothetical protein